MKICPVCNQGKLYYISFNHFICDYCEVEMGLDEEGKASARYGKEPSYLTNKNKRSKKMHYKNGREAKNGDKIIWMPEFPQDADGNKIGLPTVGILYDAVVGNDFCNGRIAITTNNDPYPNLKECLHIDDIGETPTRLEVEKVVANPNGSMDIFFKDKRLLPINVSKAIEV